MKVSMISRFTTALIGLSLTIGPAFSEVVVTETEPNGVSDNISNTTNDLSAFGSVRIGSTRDLTDLTPPSGSVAIDGGSVVTVESTAGSVFEQIDIGRLPGQTGSLTVTGTGSGLYFSGAGTDEFVRIGRAGQATFSVSDGAVVQLGDANSAGTTVGRGDGSLLPIGAFDDSLFNNPTFDANNPPTALPLADESLLSVTSGGNVLSYGNLAIASSVSDNTPLTNGHGKVLVSGADSELNVLSGDTRSGDIRVGETGVGSLHVEDSGNVTADSVVIGGGPGTGTLSLSSSGTILAPEVLVGSGGTIQGDGGSIIGNVTLDGGTIAPGASPGILNIDGDLNFISGLLEFEIGGTGAGQFDVLNITGDLISTGTPSIAFNFINGFAPEPDDIFEVLNVGGNFPDGFSNLLSSDFLISGLSPDAEFGVFFESGSFGLTTINGGTTVIPLPAGLPLLLTGLGGLAWLRRRKNAKG